MAETLTVKIFRLNPKEDKAPRFDVYKLEKQPRMTVLDVLFYIQNYLDGSLAFRSCCRAAVCGSCAMHINGMYRLACRTQVSTLGKEIIIRPLSHLKILKDLITDMTPFWEKYKYIKPYLMPGSPPEDKNKERYQKAYDQEKLIGLIDCILCGACYGACPITLSSKNYLGPAALLKAYRFVVDTRDKALEERLLLVGEENGVWRCHTVFNCQKVCPKSLDPTGAIGALKREILTRKAGLIFVG